LDIHLTGNGIEMHKDLISFITETRLGMINQIIHKHRSIDRIYDGLSYLINIKYPILYQITNPISNLDLSEVKNSRKIDKKFIDFAGGETLNYPVLLVNMKSGISYYKIEYSNGPLIKTIGSVFGESTLSAMTR